MTPIKQKTDYSCALACIESLATDKNIPRHTQVEIMQDYPEICSVGRLDNNIRQDGAVSMGDFFVLLRKLNLASTFLVGTGRPFIEQNKDRRLDGIFLHTTCHGNGKHGGYHCWRLENTGDHEVVLVEPSPHEKKPYITHPWGHLETTGCVVVVCIP